MQDLQRLRLQDVKSTCQDDCEAVLKELTKLTFLEWTRTPHPVSSDLPVSVHLPSYSSLARLLHLQVCQPQPEDYVEAHNNKNNQTYVILHQASDPVVEQNANSVELDHGSTVEIGCVGAGLDHFGCSAAISDTAYDAAVITEETEEAHNHKGKTRQKNVYLYLVI